MESLNNKIAFVTGGGSGIGRATALAFADRGAKVVIADLNTDGGKETQRLIEEDGGEALFVSCDVGDAGEVAAAIDRCVAVYGRLDCAFNNAGILGEMSTTADCSEENFDRIMRVNLKGVWLCMKHEIPQMIRQGGGAIVNASSIAGLVGVAGQPIYVASKHGVTGLTKAVGVEYAQQGVRINAVCPGLIRTDLMERIFKANPELRGEANDWQPMGRVGEPEEVAEAVVWLSSDKASFVVGHTLTIDGGLVAK